MLVFGGNGKKTEPQKSDRDQPNEIKVEHKL
jgi:hypothetical protein